MTTAAVWCTSGTLIEAVQARNLLDQVLLDRDVESPGRRRHAPGVGARRRTRHPKAVADDCRISASRDLGAEHQSGRAPVAGAPGAASASSSASSATSSGPATPPARVEDQPRRSLERALLQRRIDAALEALRGIGHEPVAAAAPGDGLRREPGDLEQHVGRALDRCPSRSPPMTPARPSALLWSAITSTDSSIVTSRPSSRRKRLARARAAHDDAAVDLAPVIGVHAAGRARASRSW